MEPRSATDSGVESSDIHDARDAKRDAAYKQRGEAPVLFLTQREVEQNDRDEDHEAEE